MAARQKKIDELIIALGKADRAHVTTAIAELDDAEMQIVARVLNRNRGTILQKNFSPDKSLGRKKILIDHSALKFKGSLFGKSEESQEPDEISEEEQIELNEKYAARARTPKSEFIQLNDIHEAFDLVRKQKEEEGWKYKGEK